MDARNAKQWVISLLMALLPLSSIAQNQSRNPADPANPAQPAAALAYESAFKGYQAAADSGEASDQIWRAANDEVARLRGHAGHLRAAEPDKAASPSSPTPKSAPAPAQSSGHAAHHSHGGK